MAEQDLAQIEQSLLKFVYRKFPRARKQEAGLDDHLLENRLIDSLGLLDIIMYIENTYGYTIDDQDVTLENFASVRTIAQYVQQLAEMLD